MRTNFIWFGTVVLLVEVISASPVRPRVATVDFCDVPMILPISTRPLVDSIGHVPYEADILLYSKLSRLGCILLAMLKL